MYKLILSTKVDAQTAVSQTGEDWVMLQNENLLLRKAQAVVE